MKYNPEVLKEMIKVKTANIKMFSKYDGEYAEIVLAQLVADRRYLAALVENDGQEDDNFRGKVDYMAYTACMPNADTSWWTKGT